MEEWSSASAEWKKDFMTKFMESRAAEKKPKESRQATEKVEVISPTRGTWNSSFLRLRVISKLTLVCGQQSIRVGTRRNL